MINRALRELRQPCSRRCAHRMRTQNAAFPNAPCELILQETKSVLVEAWHAIYLGHCKYNRLISQDALQHLTRWACALKVSRIHHSNAKGRSALYHPLDSLQSCAVCL